LAPFAQIAIWVTGEGVRMPLIDITVEEIEARATPKLILFGSSDDHYGEAEPDSAGVSVSGVESTGGGSLLALLAVLAGIALAVWLARRR
jgi:hypothetical protein